MSTQNTIRFLETVMQSLAILAMRAKDTRFDLIGSVPPSEPQPPAQGGTPEFSTGDTSFENSVEYYGSRINEHMNELDRELSFLRENVNHKSNSKGTAVETARVAR